MSIIQIFTDGACLGNPGYGGIAVCLKYGEHERHISEYIGFTTNNIAELKAIEVGLFSLNVFDIPVMIYTDSAYAIGVLTKKWKAKKNKNLIRSIKMLIEKFDSCEFVKVKGHSDNEYNNLADKLAKDAIKKYKPIKGEMK